MRRCRASEEGDHRGRRWLPRRQHDADRGGITSRRGCLHTAGGRGSTFEMRPMRKLRRPAESLPNPHPGEILMEEFLRPEALSQTALAQAIGVPPRRINEIVLGKRTITDRK